MKRTILIGMIAIIPLLGKAQLLTVNQTVYGMDCAPCAYGVEKGIQKIKGVQSVKVSLNQGKAYIHLAPENRVTLAGIQQEIQNNGFSAREAEVVVQGKLLKNTNGLSLVTQQNEHYLLIPTIRNGLLDKLKAFPSDALVRLKGTVQNQKKGGGHPWVLQVSEIL